MKLTEIPGGFALYKEKTEIGCCRLTPTAQGADLALLSIVPEWRRKGYGSYLLKEILRAYGGYDREKATVFTAPLPADTGGSRRSGRSSASGPKPGGWSAAAPPT